MSIFSTQIFKILAMFTYSKQLKWGLKRVSQLLASYLCGNRCPVHLIASMARSAAHMVSFWKKSKLASAQM